MGSSWTRGRTCIPCIGRQILNHWTTREAWSGDFLFIFLVIFNLRVSESSGQIRGPRTCISSQIQVTSGRTTPWEDCSVPLTKWQWYPLGADWNCIASGPTQTDWITYSKDGNQLFCVSTALQWLWHLIRRIAVLSLESLAVFFWPSPSSEGFCLLSAVRLGNFLLIFRSF